MHMQMCRMYCSYIGIKCFFFSFVITLFVFQLLHSRFDCISFDLFQKQLLILCYLLTLLIHNLLYHHDVPGMFALDFVTGYYLPPD